MNVIADALSMQNLGHAGWVITQQKQFIRDFDKLELLVINSSSEDVIFLNQLTIQSILRDKIRDSLDQNEKLLKVINMVKERHLEEYEIDEEELLKYRGRIYIYNVNDLRKEILQETHLSGYTIHPRINKIYQDLNEIFWWPGLKRSVIDFVSKYLTCQLVNVEYQKLGGQLQPLPILE